VNYDLPVDPESYVHRIGRTGRMGRKGEAWSFVSSGDIGQLDKISNTWNLEIPIVEVPDLADGARELNRFREDWDDLSDKFGMVTIRLSIEKGKTSKLGLANWILKEAKIPEVAIGEIELGNEESTVEVHLKKAPYVIDVLKKRKFDGRDLKPDVVT